MISESKVSDSQTSKNTEEKMLATSSAHQEDE